MASKVIGEQPAVLHLASLPGAFQHVLSLRLWDLNKCQVTGIGRFPLHTHVYYELIIPLRGSYRCSLNGVEVAALAPGSYLLIQPGDTHEDNYGPGLEFLAMLFSLRDMTSARWPGSVIATTAPTASRILSPQLGSLADSLMGLIATFAPEKAGDLVNLLSLEALCEAFFWSLFEDMPRDHLSQEFAKILGENEFRIKAIAYFKARSGEALDLDRMAAALSVSRRALGYKFNAVFGTSPAKAFMSWRIGRAASLLEAGASVKDAASALGFANPFHFSRAFRRETGFPPSAPGRGRH
jgi:AraC-like DNA-binding protein